MERCRLVPARGGVPANYGTATVTAMAQRGLVTMDDRELNKFERSLRKAKATAIPAATREMLNRAAKQTWSQARSNVRARMTIRARGGLGAIGSIRFDRARGNRIRSMESVIGSIAPYMVKQEFGGTKTSGGKRGVAIPTTTASGEADSQVPRQRLVRKAHLLGNVRLSRRRNTSNADSRGRRAMIAYLVAKQHGDKFVFLDLLQRPGIYKVTARGPRLLYETKRRTVAIPRNPWLLPALQTVRPRMPAIWRTALRKQLIRNRIKWRI